MFFYWFERLRAHDAGSKVQTGPDSIDLGFIPRLKLRLFGIVNVGDRMVEGWSSSLPVYAFRCKKHGLQCARASTLLS